MRKVTLYSAMSLDGFIARPDGSIDWLEEGGGTDSELLIPRKLKARENFMKLSG